MGKKIRSIDKDTDAKMIGRNIEFYRKCCDFSVQFVAQRIGMGRSTIDNYEKGRYRPSLNAVEKLAELFKVKVSDLLYCDKQMEKDKTKPKTPFDRPVKAEKNMPKKAVCFKMDAKDFIMLNKVIKAKGKTQGAFVVEAIRTEYANMMLNKRSNSRREYNAWNHKSRVVGV